MKSILILLLLGLPLAAQAKRFSNTYISFELPNNWNCKLEGTEWVCGSQYRDKSTQAIIVLTAKESGPTDTLQAYKAHLNAPRSILSAKGFPQRSKVLHIRERNLANHGWVDGMHLGSEVTDFYTRYLATVKGRLAIVVTFSAHKKYYTQYSSDFLRAIESLKVVASKGLLSGASPSPPQVNPQQKWFPVHIPNQIKQIEAPPVEGEGSESLNVIFGIAILLAAGGVYLFSKEEKVMKKIALLILFFLSVASQAKVLETSYLITQVPDDWDCQLDNNQWICRSETEGYDTRVVASFSAKQSSPEEKIENFLKHFKNPKSIISKAGRSVVSQVISAKIVNVNRIKWVEAIHLESELPNYYTHYMATVNGGVTLLLQFSAHKEVFEIMKPYFTSVILNTRLRKLGEISMGSAPNQTTSGSIPTTGQAEPSPSTQAVQELPEPPPSQNRSWMVVMVFVGIAATFLGLVFLRKKKK